MRRPELMPKRNKSTRRICLKCNKSFWSEGNFKRLCVKCNDSNMQRQTIGVTSSGYRASEKDAP